MGKEGLTFCIELCAHALQTDLKNDPVTKSLVYKTIAYMFPHDLEICRACALLVFFLERTVEAYKTVYFLYNHPDLEYHLDAGPVGNNVRFEVIQILKKGLFFDPEFWSLLNIKTNCLKLMSDEVARAAVCEIMEEDKWASSYCVREHCKCRTETERTITQEAKPGSRDKQESGMMEKRIASPSGDLSSESPLYKRRGRRPGTRLTKDLDQYPVRRSFRQLDLAQNHARQLSNRCQRFLTRQAEKNILKRRGRKPRWLLEQLAALEENSAPGQRKKPGRKPKLFSSLKDILVDAPAIEITMEYSYPDNEVELPADVQGCATSLTTSSTDHHFDQPQTMPCSKTPDLLLQILLEKSPASWRDKEDFQSQAVMVVIRKFHTYSKVPDEEESPLLDRVTDATALTAPCAVKEEEDFESLALVKNPSEPVEGSKVTSLSAAATQEIPGVGDGSDLPLLSPVEQPVVPESKITTMVSPPKDQTDSIMTDMSIQELENTQDDSSLNTTDNATDYIPTTSEIGTDVISTSEIAPDATPEIAPQSEVSTPKEIPDPYENLPEVKEAVDDSQDASAAKSILKTPAVLEVLKPQEPASQQTAEVEPSQKSVSPPVSSAHTTVQPKRQCKLCNIKYETPLSHALWHYRTEKKCMFCDKLAMTRGALQHFQKHIKNLSRVEVPVEPKKSEDVPKATGSPDQTVPESPPKKAKPGFAQIKSRLLMRLKLTRKAQPQRETEKSTETSEAPSKEMDAKKHVSAPEPKESSAKDEKQSVPQETIRYLTRGSVRKSQHKGRLLRTKLDRKGKTRRESSAPKDASSHRVNGVIRKKRKMWCLQEESNPAADKHATPVKEEAKTDAEKSEKIIRSHKANYDIRTKADKATSKNLEGESKNCAKAKVPEEPRVKKKKHSEDEAKVEVKAAKKRKHEEGTSTAKSEDTTEKQNPLPVVEKQQNGTEAESCETPTTGRKRKIGSAPLVGCPIDTCTFQAVPGPVLSHVLIHHPGDTKALEFFYNLAKKKCLFCARRIWTPQHFFDHVVSHRGNLKHPCYHVACQKRFKTRSHMGDHMEKDHNPLKAGCCFPGCTVESASLKDLYSHEKSHYNALTPKEDKSVTCEKGVEKPGLKASRGKSTPAETAAQQTPESVVTELETPPAPAPADHPPPSPLPPTPPPPKSESREQEKNRAPAKLEDEKPLTLNRSAVSYSSKNSRLVNGHADHAEEPSAKAPPAAPKEQETKYEKVAVKPFSRLPPSAYLDELYLSMPKKWKGPQVSAKGADADDVVPVKRQSCSRCNAAFDCEEELQLHREKCTSLFGFDSDDESKCRLETL